MSKTVIIDTDSPPGSYAEALKKPKQSERFVVALPYPPSELLPNKARTRHWASNGKVAADYKQDCLTACREAGGVLDWCPDLPVMVELSFHRHDKRHVDLDNLLAATKAGIDVISTFIGIDDKHFEFTIRRGEVRKPSVVVVTI